MLINSSPLLWSSAIIFPQYLLILLAKINKYSITLRNFKLPINQKRYLPQRIQTQILLRPRLILDHIQSDILHIQLPKINQTFHSSCRLTAQIPIQSQ